ncbi:MAG: PaaI family thioesterase [Pseudomonadota bacterium]
MADGAKGAGGAERAPVMGPETCLAYLERVFPAVEGRFEILEIASMRAVVRRRTKDVDIRPGGTVSGPAMFEAADCGFYAALLAMIGEKALAVTTNATINFLNKPAPADLICEARILKLGKLLATGDATIRSDGEARPVAHATLTYAIPPK